MASTSRSTEGEFVVFVGPSGCGKSTLLRMIAGLEDVTDGEIEIEGRDVTDLDPSKRGIAMVFQSYALYPHMSVRDNLGLRPEDGQRDRRPRSSARVKAAAAILKIEPPARPAAGAAFRRPAPARGHRPGHRAQAAMSSCSTNRCAISMRNCASRMRIEIARLHRELGNTMIYVTHDQTEAMTLADKIVVLRDGRIEQVGTPREALRRPRTTSSWRASSARRG